jgi:hypothetical protein
MYTQQLYKEIINSLTKYIPNDIINYTINPYIPIIDMIFDIYRNIRIYMKFIKDLIILKLK